MFYSLILLLCRIFRHIYKVKYSETKCSETKYSEIKQEIKPKIGRQKKRNC